MLHESTYGMALDQERSQTDVRRRNYRAEFDGLRGISILMVVLSHGGFVPAAGGVDVFFFLAGYLITGNILRDFAKGRFTFSVFYARRARRLFVPLALMLLVVMALCWLILLPDELRRLGHDVATAAGFVLNITWYRQEVTVDPAYSFQIASTDLP